MNHYHCCHCHQESCVQAQVTIHTHPGNLCSPPLPGSRDPGRSSPGEHTARFRLLQCHASLCPCRLTSNSNYDNHTPPSPWPESKRALISCCFNPLLSGWGTDSWRWPTHRSGAKTKAEPQELCEKRRERKISPCSLRSSRLNPYNQLVKHCIWRIPEQTMNVPKIEVVDFGCNWRLGVCFLCLIWFWFYVYLSLVFSAYYHWWICLLVLLLASFYIYIYFFFSPFLFLECVSVCFFVRFCLYRFAFNICPRDLSVHFIVCFCFCFSLFLFFWAVWLAGSLCCSHVSGLRLQGGRAESRTLDHQKSSGPM